jgi:hypothetical protein
MKVRAHKGGMRIGKTPQKLDNICCPQRRETTADTLKGTRPIGEGYQELEKRLEIRAKLFLPGIEGSGGGGERKGVGRVGERVGGGGEMTQTLYAHMNFKKRLF